MLANGAKLNLQDVEGNTSVHLAVTNPELSRKLLQIILDYDDTALDVKNNKGETVLMMAMKYNNRNAVDEILARLGTPESTIIDIEESQEQDDEEVIENTLIDDVKKMIMVFSNGHPTLTGVEKLNEVNNNANIDDKIYLREIAAAWENCIQNLTQGQSSDMFDSRAKSLTSVAQPTQTTGKAELELLCNAILQYAEYMNRPRVMYSSLYPAIQNLEQLLIAEQKRDVLVEIDSLEKKTTSYELHNLYFDFNEYIMNSKHTESLKQVMHSLRQPDMSDYHEMVNERNINAITKNIIAKTPNPKDVVKKHLLSQDKQELKGPTNK